MHFDGASFVYGIGLTRHRKSFQPDNWKVSILTGDMLDFELQQRLKQHKADIDQERRGRATLIVVSLLAGILIGVTGGYVYRSVKIPSYETELNLMIVLAAESQNLDPAATLRAVEQEIGKPVSDFSQSDIVEAFKYLVRNTKRDE